MSLSIAEAAELVHKSQPTIRRWKAAGIDVSDPVKLFDHSELQDIRARGKAAKMALRRTSDHQSRTPEPERPESSLRSYFQGVGQDEPYVELPPPYRQEVAGRALDALTSIRDAFARRLEELKAIGH